MAPTTKVGSSRSRTAIPGIRQDYADQEEADWTKRFSQMTQLYNMGMLTQRQFAQMVGLPGADAYPDVLKTSGSGSTHLIPYTTAKGREGTVQPRHGEGHHHPRFWALRGAAERAYPEGVAGEELRRAPVPLQPE